MATSIFCIVLLLIGLVAFAVALSRRKPRTTRKLAISDHGTIIDRSLWSYRQHLVPLLVVSMLFLPLGNISPYSNTFFVLLTPTLLFLNADDLDTMLFLFASFAGMFGIGRTLLTCGITQAMHATNEGQTPIGLKDVLPRTRLGAVAGLTALMIIPSVLMSFIGLFGALLSIYFVLAPAVMYYESSGPFAAVRHSFKLAHDHSGGVINTLVPLWVIGWLVVGTLVGGTYAIAQLVTTLPAYAQQLALALGWLLGNIFTMPLMSLGALHLYLYIRDLPPAPIPGLVASWQGHTIVLRNRLVPRYLWLGPRTRVLVDGQEVARSVGFQRHEELPGTFQHEEHPQRITTRIQGAFLRPLRYEITINDEPLEQGKLRVENRAEGVLVLVLVGVTAAIVALIVLA